jgi:DNA-binding NarL/FixJ family response regulator
VSVRKLVVASEVPLYAKSLQWMLSQDEGLEVVAAPCGGVSLQDLAQCQADALLIECGGLLDWSGLAALCRQAAPRPVIVLTRHAPMETVYQAREAGVRALIDLRPEPPEVLEAIQRALNGEMVYPESDEEVRQRSRRVRLTPREGQLVTLLVQGLKNKEIAAQLELSEGTVKVYLSKLFQKVGAKDRFELALFGLRNLVNGEFGCVEPARRRKAPRAEREMDRRGLRTLLVGSANAVWAAKAGSRG